MTDSGVTKVTPILVEFTSETGVETIAIFQRQPEELKERSEKAINKAMETIEEMAKKIHAIHNKIPNEFSQAEFEFGIKFDWKLGAFMAEIGNEASINVTLTWTRPPS